MTSLVKRVPDLMVVVPDRDYEAVITGLFSRPESLNIRPIDYDVVVHVQRDPGCRLDCSSLLRPYINQFQHALVLFDREGSGAEAKSRTAIESTVEEDLGRNGWKDRSAAIVVDPEIEAWVWSDSPRVDFALGWPDRQTDVRAWLKSNTSFWGTEATKPDRPKEAMAAALRKARKPASAAIFQELSESVGVKRCTDPAFAKFKEVLVDWFAKDT